MNKCKFWACISLFFFSNAHATLIIDQENPTVTANRFCNMWINRHYDCGQSFMQDNNNLAGVGIHIDSLIPADDGTLSISVYDSYGSTLGNLLVSGTSAAVNSNSGWVDVFWPAISVKAAFTYYFVLTSTQDYLSPTYTGDSYARGSALAFRETDDYYLQYDLNFRTYYDDYYGEVIDTPEPSSISLFGLSLLGLSYLRKKSVVAA